MGTNNEQKKPQSGKLLLIIIIALIIFAIDAATSKCIQNNPQLFLVVLCHHLIFTFVLLGWILDDPVVLLIYIAIPIIVALHWSTNKNNCMFDQITSEICGENTQFRHLATMCGIPWQVIQIVVAIGILIAIYKLFKILKSRKLALPNHSYPNQVYCKT